MRRAREMRTGFRIAGLLGSLLLAMPLSATAGSTPVKRQASERQPEYPIRDWLLTGWFLTDERALELERRLCDEPGDLSLRAKLLSCYEHRRFAGRTHHADYLRQGLALIATAPDSSLLRNGFFANLSPRIDGAAAYEAGAQAWRDQIAQFPKSAAVRANAAQYFLVHRTPTAVQLLQEAGALDPRSAEWPFRLGFALSLRLDRLAPAGRRRTAAQSLAAYQRSLVRKGNREWRQLSLVGAGEMAIACGRLREARLYATELLAETRKGGAWPGDGDAFHQAHTTLGRAALRSGDKAGARRHLLTSARIGDMVAAVASSFGPEMTLARDLLERGERRTVLQYFALCRDFWNGRLDGWTEQVRQGKTPDFR